MSRKFTYYGSYLSTPPFTQTKSLYLDGVNESVNIDSVFNNSLKTQTKGTIAFWLNMRDVSSIQIQISFADTDNNRFFYFGSSNTNFWFNSYNKGTYSLRYTGGGFMSTGWTHWIITQAADGTGVHFYKNNVEVFPTWGGTDLDGWISSIPFLDNGRIGSLKYNNSADGFFSHNNIDELLFMSEPATLAQRNFIYNGGVPQDLSGIANAVAFYRFGDASGDNWNTDTPNEWNFEDQIGVNDIFTTNCEEEDVETNIP